MSSTPGSVKRAVIHVLRIGIGIALAVGLVSLTLKSTGTNLWLELQRSNKGWLGIALLLYGGVIAITVRRWSLLLAVQGVHLSFWSLWRLSMIGAFFNLAIPGAVSGDLLKMAYIVRQAPDKKAESVLTIMLDRVVGVLGLFIVATVMVVTSLPTLLRLGPEHRPIQLAVFTVALGSVGGIVAVLLVELRQQLMQLRWLRAVIDFGASKLPHAVVDTIQRLAEALELYRRKRRTILVTLALSLLVHTLLGTALLCIGKGVGEQNLKGRDYFLAMQVGNAVAAIPVTPGGVGTRDMTIAKFFEALGTVPDAERTAWLQKVGSVPLITSLIIVFWALVGAAVFVLGPRIASPADAARAADDTAAAGSAVTPRDLDATRPGARH